MAASTPLDLRVVVAEIYDEVDRRRRSGEIPAGLERELADAFARYAPPAPTDEDFGALLEHAERSAFVNVDVPTASRVPGVAHVKRVLRKLMAWYLRYLAQQVSALGGALVRAVAVLGKRVDRLEAAAPGLGTAVPGLAVAAPAGPLDPQWRSILRAQFTGELGRVLVGECGDGAAVRELVDAGADAYGVDPRREHLVEALRSGLDVRADDLVEHLTAVPAGSLGGLVLLGAPERLSGPQGAQLAELAALALGAGSTIVVLSAHPAAWARLAGPVAVDLAPGRPLAPETWAHLLTVNGFAVRAVELGAPTEVLAPIPGDDATAAAINQNLGRLAELAFPPERYAVVATRR